MEEGSRARVFPDPQVELPGHGGNLYEMFYADSWAVSGRMVW